MLSAKQTHAFTIVAKNYLHYAIVLMNSIARYLPDARRTVVICDRLGDIDPEKFSFEVVELESLPIPHIDRLLCQYTILELNTAIKPYVFSYLLDKKDTEKVIYFDPDIQVYSNLTPMIELLEQHDILLTPHITDFFSDDRHPSDLSILQSGTYNLGFLALRSGESACRLLQWWQKKLLRDCVVDIPRGLFTDQKWMDLIPGVFPKSAIIRNPGWNVAYWNLEQRHVACDQGEYTVNGYPLIFFHFSGYVPGSDSISKHQNRFCFGNLPQAVRLLFDNYIRSAQSAGMSSFVKLPYAFDVLADGTPIPQSGRVLLRKHLDWSEPLPDLRTEEGCQWICRFFTKPVDSQQPVITCLAQALYHQRSDLQAAFPDYLGTHRQAFCHWFSQNAEREEGIAATFIPASVMDIPDTKKTSDSEVHAVEESMSPYQKIYQMAWKMRALVRPFLPQVTRARIRNFLLNRAYKSQDFVSQKVKHLNLEGINLVGYLRSESGIGESARSMLRALNARDIPCSLVDFRVGNVSRKEEDVDASLELGARYDLNLFHINADQILLARGVLGQDYFRTSYRIGYWAWELQDFPQEWNQAFAYLDEIWVPSTFCQRAIAKSAPVPVVCVPHSIEVDRFVASDRHRFELNPEHLVFFTMADMLSVPERKNPFGVVEAFARAFPAGDEPVTLVVKISNGSVRTDVLSRIQEYADRLPTIRLIDGYLDREMLYRLIESSDVFVSLHRSEGFGLGIAEAMSRGKAVLATGWSGNMDFMNNSNALVVPYRLIELDQDYGPYSQGSVWAEPDLDQAAMAMQRLLNEPVLRFALGEQAKKDCREQLSPSAVGAIVQARLETIRDFCS